MPRNRPNFIQTNNGNGVNIMETLDILNLRQVPAASQTPVTKAVMKRGPQLMVVFSGSPLASDVQALREAGVKVGLAVAPSEFSNVLALNDYSYVFTGFGRQGGSPLKQAIADLAHNGWSLDDNGRAAPISVPVSTPRLPAHRAEMVWAQA